MDKKDTGFWAGLLAGIKDAIEPKLNPGDSIPGMSGGRASQLLSGGTCLSSSESKMFATYVEKMTQVGDPRRAQYSYAANEARRKGYTPILALLIGGAFIALLYYGLPIIFRNGYITEQMERMPRIDQAPIGRISTPQYINISRDEFDEPIAGVISILPKGYDSKSYPRDKYRIFEGEGLIAERKAHPKPHKLVLKLVPGGCEIKDPDDMNNIEYHHWMYENQKFYTFNGSDSVWHQAYKVPELDRIGWNPKYAVVYKGTNIIIRFE